MGDSYTFIGLREKIGHPGQLQWLNDIDVNYIDWNTNEPGRLYGTGHLFGVNSSGWYSFFGSDITHKRTVTVQFSYYLGDE